MSKKIKDIGYVCDSGLGSYEYNYPYSYYKKTGKCARTGFRTKKEALKYQQDFLKEYSKNKTTK